MVALRAIDQGVTVLPFSSFSGAAGLWHLTSFRRVLPGLQALYYGSGETGWHGWGAAGSLGGAPTTGTVLSNLVDLSSVPAGRFRVFLRWWQFAHFRTQAGVDLPTIEVRVGASTVQTFAKADITGIGGGGVGTITGFKLVELTAAPGTQFRVRLGFDSVDAPSAAEGWFVQDLKLLIRRV